MVEFKVGDIVKLINLQDIEKFAPHLKIGDVGTVKSRSISGNRYVVLFNYDDQRWAFDTFELELVT